MPTAISTHQIIIQRDRHVPLLVQEDSPSIPLNNDFVLLTRDGVEQNAAEFISDFSIREKTEFPANTSPGVQGHGKLTQRVQRAIYK